MSVLSRLASAQGVRSDAPNQALARDLARTQDREGIREVVAGLTSRDRRVQSECIKVLYEIGYIDPELIAEYAAEFFRLLGSRNNRLVWGGMIALSTIARLRPQEVFDGMAGILEEMAQGSVITVDAGVAALAAAAATGAERRAAILPCLLEHLSSCRPNSVAQHAEKMLEAVDAAHCERFVAILQARLPELTASQQTRVRRVIGKAGKQGVWEEGRACRKAGRASLLRGTMPRLQLN